MSTYLTSVVSMSDSTPDDVLFMCQVTSSLLNEKTRRNTIETDNTQAFVTEKMERSESMGSKGVVATLKVGHKLGKSLESIFIVARRATSRRIVFLWRNIKKPTMRRRITIKLQLLWTGENEACLSVIDNQVEWDVDTVASYHATFCREMFMTYKAGDFATVKMGNRSHSMIVGIDDVFIQTNVDCRLTPKDVRYVPDLRWIRLLRLQRAGYEIYFRNGRWKLTKGSFVIARGKVSNTILYKTHVKLCKGVLNVLKINPFQICSIRDWNVWVRR